MTPSTKAAILKRCESDDDVSDPSGNYYLQSTNVIPIITELLQIIEKQDAALGEMSKRTQSYGMMRVADKALSETTEALKRLAGE